MSVTDTETPNSMHFVGEKNMYFHGQFSFENLCSRTKHILCSPAGSRGVRTTRRGPAQAGQVERVPSRRWQAGVKDMEVS